MNRKKLQKYIFILLLILLPTQLGYHFWPEWAFVNGIRVDYFAPTLYVTDLLVFLLAGLEIPHVKLGKLGKLGTLGIFVILNIYFSYSPMVSLYKWLKVGEFGFLAWFVTKRIKFEAKWLLIPIVYESVLAIWQYINQGSVGGLWWWLGERTFTSGTAGIANAIINGALVLRPYGTLPHPNVLAGFLIVSTLLVLRNLPHISRKITALIVCLVATVLLLTPSHGDLLKGLSLRQDLNNLAIQQFSNQAIFGTGLGTSPMYERRVTNYALVHQPIHNIYLLILSELGVLGILGILGTIKIKKMSLALGAILILGFFDHYFLTLQQGQILLALTIGEVMMIEKL